MALLWALPTPEMNLAIGSDREPSHLNNHHKITKNVVLSFKIVKLKMQKKEKRKKKKEGFYQSLQSTRVSNRIRAHVQLIVKTANRFKNWLNSGYWQL